MAEAPKHCLTCFHIQLQGRKKSTWGMKTFFKPFPRCSVLVTHVMTWTDMLYAHTFRKVKVVLSSGNVHRNTVFCLVVLLI